MNNSTSRPPGIDVRWFNVVASVALVPAIVALGVVGNAYVIALMPRDSVRISRRAKQLYLILAVCDLVALFALYVLSYLLHDTLYFFSNGHFYFSIELSHWFDHNNIIEAFAQFNIKYLNSYSYIIIFRIVCKAIRALYQPIVVLIGFLLIGFNVERLVSFLWPLRSIHWLASNTFCCIRYLIAAIPTMFMLTSTVLVRRTLIE